MSWIHLDFCDLPRDAVYDLVYWGWCYISGWCCILPQLTYLDGRDRYANGALQFLVSREWPGCPMKTWPHSQGTLQMPCVFSPRSSFTSWRKLEIFINRRPTDLTWMDSTLLIQLMTVPQNGKRATKTESSLSRNSDGLTAWRIWWLL
jgi:hypothetical protein